MRSTWYKRFNLIGLAILFVLFVSCGSAMKKQMKQVELENERQQLKMKLDTFHSAYVAYEQKNMKPPDKMEDLDIGILPQWDRPDLNAKVTINWGTKTFNVKDEKENQKLLAYQKNADEEGMRVVLPIGGGAKYQTKDEFDKASKAK